MEDPVRHANHRFMSRVRAWRWRRALWGGKALWGSYSRSWMWTDPDRRRRHSVPDEILSDSIQDEVGLVTVNFFNS